MRVPVLGADGARPSVQPIAQLAVDGHGALLSVGVRMSAGLPTGQRRIIGFLLSPLAQRMKEAGRER